MVLYNLETLRLEVQVIFLIEKRYDLFTKSERALIWLFWWMQSLLIEGRGQYNCSLAAHFSNGSSPMCELRKRQCIPHILHVLPKKTYRLRIASTTALASLNLAIGVSLISFISSLNQPTSAVLF